MSFLTFPGPDEEKVVTKQYCLSINDACGLQAVLDGDGEYTAESK